MGIVEMRDLITACERIAAAVEKVASGRDVEQELRDVIVSLQHRLAEYESSDSVVRPPGLFR
jgi:hypothetical protein